jgi:hypothetical protein
LSAIFCFSAASNSAILATPSTRTRVPNTCTPKKFDRRHTPIHLDFVRVHGRVCDENACILHALGLINTGHFFEQESVIQIRVGHTAAELLQ